MIPQIEPWIDDEELKEVAEVVRSTWLTESDKTAAFESLFRETTGTPFARAVCNGTMSLFMAMKILGIGPGDEVIFPNLTFIATSNAILLAGGTPVPVDVNKDTFTIFPDSIKTKITARTKAVIPVHLYGQSADMEAVMEIARANRLYVIEDAAQGVGVKFKGKHVGTFGDFGCFSFYGNKTITTGEGGMIVTGNGEYDQKIYAFKNHGRGKRGTFVHDEIGYNFSFNELAAAVGLSQLRKLDRIIERKKAIRKAYEAQLSGIKNVQFPTVDARCLPVYWFTNILVDDPGALQDFLQRKGIGSRRFFYPVNRQPCYAIDGYYPNSDYAYAHGLSLPSGAILDLQTVQGICREIKAFYGA